jgi:hypothetical protein
MHGTNVFGVQHLNKIINILINFINNCIKILNIFSITYIRYKLLYILLLVYYLLILKIEELN